MSYLGLTDKIFVLLLSTCLFSIKVTSTQEGSSSSYFFYQQSDYPGDCKEARDQCSSDTFSDVYTIKPDGYPQPFEVYCNNDIASGGWTVIQRQLDGFLTFRRNWEDYKSGFGFLSSEYWIGLEKLSYLTNQAVYELRIDMVLSNGSSFYVNYNSFRISDEWSDYAIVSAEEFRSNWSCIISTCPLNMIRDGCTCQRLCTDPIGQTDCYTDCVETCEPEGCIVPGKNTFILNGESFINVDCTQNCICVDNHLSCDVDYQCSTDATCTVRDEIRKCYCNDNFEGDGETCTRVRITNFTDCYDVYQADYTTDGIYTIQPKNGPSFDVFCDMTFGDGGWTVFQRRIDGVTDFYRNWEEYKQGFGTLNQGNDFWLGNEQLHFLTDQKDYMLRIDFVETGDTQIYEEYTTFKIGNESTKYQLSYASYSDGNNAGRTNRLDRNNGRQFSTRDQDNDGCSRFDCAEEHKGGWWYSDNWCYECGGSRPHCIYFETRSDCHNLCTAVNLNGDYNGVNGENIFYETSYYGDCNHKFAEMKIRPSST